MVWGAFMSSGVRYLEFIEGSVNSEKYISILEGALPQIYDKSGRNETNTYFL